MTVLTAYIVSILILLVAMAASTFLVDKASPNYQAINIVRLGFLTIAIGFLLGVWIDLPGMPFVSIICTNAGVLTLFIFPVLRAGRKPSTLFIFCYLAFDMVSRGLVSYFGLGSEMVYHIGTLVFSSGAAYMVLAIRKYRDISPKSFMVLGATLLSAVLIFIVRSYLIEFHLEVHQTFVVTYMVFWPALYATTMLAVISSYLEEAQRTMTKMARTDGLTGLNNRRFWEECLTREFDRLQRRKSWLSSVIIFDIDHFKQVNDTYGHTAGDQAIRQVADLLKAHLRRTDVAGRYGGEEYVVLLADTTAEDAMVFAERIRTAQAAALLDYEGQVIQFTVSLGIAGFDPTFENVVDWIAAADTALYRSKENGRNRTSVYQPEISAVGRAFPDDVIDALIEDHDNIKRATDK